MEVIGLDHVYLSVSDFGRAEAFYDRVMRALGYFKGARAIAGEPHAHYFNRVMQISIRPARSPVEGSGRPAAHDPYAPGLHHLCLQLRDPTAVDEAHAALQSIGVEATPPAPYPEYAPDYYATFFQDPDGLRFELVARRSGRDAVVREWDQLREFVNPMQELEARAKVGER